MLLTELRGVLKQLPYLVIHRDTSHLDKYFRITRSLNAHTFTYTLNIVPSSEDLLPLSVPSSTLVHPQLRSTAVTIDIAAVTDRNVVWAEMQVRFVVCAKHSKALLFI